MSTITDALRAARACILQDRTSLADTGMRPDNTIEPDAAAGVDEYDAVLQQIDAALAGMTHHITDEQPAKAPASLADIQRKLVSAQSCNPRAVQTLIAEALDLIDDVARSGIGAAPAPAVPSDEPAEFERAYNRLFRGRGVDTRHISDCEAVWMARAALTAAPTPPAQAKCLTCNGHGLIGGHMQDGSGYGEGCPDCNPEPEVPESADSDEEAQPDDDSDVTGQPGPLPEHGWDGGPAAPTDQMEINIRICVPPDFARRGDMQSIIEREIKADRWCWHDLPAVPEDVARDAERWVALSTAIVESLSREADSDEIWEHPFLAAFEKAIGDHQGPVSLEQYNAWADAARAAEKGGA